MDALAKCMQYLQFKISYHWRLPPQGATQREDLSDYIVVEFSSKLNFYSLKFLKLSFLVGVNKSNGAAGLVIHILFYLFFPSWLAEGGPRRSPLESRWTLFLAGTCRWSGREMFGLPSSPFQFIGRDCLLVMWIVLLLHQRGWFGIAPLWNLLLVRSFGATDVELRFRLDNSWQTQVLLRLKLFL